MTNELPIFTDDDIDQVMTAAVIDNTAQGVLHKLEELELNRDHVLTRWVWSYCRTHVMPRLILTQASLPPSI